MRVPQAPLGEAETGRAIARKQEEVGLMIVWWMTVELQGHLLVDQTPLGRQHPAKKEERQGLRRERQAQPIHPPRLALA